MTYDAIMLASFGGPRKPEDVVPFLRNVTHGRGIPDDRLEEVGEHYYMFGGASPINEQNDALAGALRDELARRGVEVPLVVGNRNWDPYTTDVLRDVARSAATQDGGDARVLAVITSAYSSYSGCRQYREDFAQAVGTLGEEGLAVTVDKTRAPFNTPGFVRANVDAVVDAFDAAPEGAELVFVTHSIPTTMEAASAAAGLASYDAQHREVARLVAEGAGERLGRDLPWRLVYCSRSGAPHVPWLEPDVNDALEEMAEAGTRAVVLSPIGFISDHMEVAYDLDTEARATAERLGLGFVRAATVGTHPEWVSSLVDVIEERIALAEGRETGASVVGDLGPWPVECAPTCCFVRDGVDTGKPVTCQRND